MKSVWKNTALCMWKEIIQNACIREKCQTRFRGESGQQLRPEFALYMQKGQLKYWMLYTIANREQSVSHHHSGVSPASPSGRPHLLLGTTLQNGIGKLGGISQKCNKKDQRQASKERWKEINMQSLAKRLWHGLCQGRIYVWRGGGILW